MEIINLTPHEIVVLRSRHQPALGDNIMWRFDESELREYARVDYDDELFDDTGKTLPVPIYEILNERVRIYTLADPSSNSDSATHKSGAHPTLGSFSEWPKDMPEEREGVYYIVSCRVAAVLSSRSDLLVPYGIVKNRRGEITGCVGFTNGCDGTRRCGVVE